MPSLSIKKSIEKRRERRRQEYRQALAGTTGIYFAPDLKAEKDVFPFLKYAVNALILFTAVFGTIDCFITAFGLELNIVPLIITCIAGSLALSFMYFSNKAKIITYLFILAGSITVSGRWYAAINSGMNSIVNSCLKHIDDAVSLPYLREYNVYYDDEYVAMSLTVCVVAVLLMVILNIFISEKMNLMAMFFLTFPAIMAGMYFDFDASKPAMLCIVTSFTVVAGVRFTNSYNGLTRQMTAQSSVKKHRHSYGFVTDSNNVARIAAVWLAFILILTGAVFAVVPTDSFEVNLPTNAIKTYTERSVKNFLSYGFSSMFTSDKTSSTPGQLSNLSQISFDGKTDLKVTLVNYRVDRVYLRSFVGYNYNGNRLSWENPESEAGSEETYNYSGKVLEDDFEKDKAITKSRHKMIIELVDSSLMSTPVNVPYYTQLSGDNYIYETSGSVKFSDISQAMQPQEYTFYTVDGDDYSSVPETETGNEIREDAYENALTVPDRNIEAIKKFCDKYNISSDDEDPVSEVVAALESDYEYTLKPGKIPYGEDYVNYFLLGSQKGYCQHFATAATLIFRYLGIPARYAEGYAVDRTDFYDAETLLDEDYTEWIDTPYVTDMTVSEVEISDDKGHAWVEVYEDGLGWTPVEATAAASEDEASLLSSIFRVASPLSSATSDIAERVRNIDRAKTMQRLIILAAVLVSALLGYYFIRMAVIVARRHKKFRTGNARTDLSGRYDHVYEIYRAIFADGEDEKSFSGFSAVMEKNGWLGEMSADEFCTETEHELFGREADGEKCARLINTLKICRKKAVKQMSIKQKFRYYFRYILW